MRLPARQTSLICVGLATVVPAIYNFRYTHRGRHSLNLSLVNNYSEIDFLIAFGPLVEVFNVTRPWPCLRGNLFNIPGD
jgi:hypothetical protein